MASAARTMVSKSARGVFRQAGLGGGDEVVERLVDGGAAGEGVGLAAGRVEPAQAQDLLGVDAVGVADQPLDLGDRELARAGRGRRARGRAAGGRDRGGREVEAGGGVGEGGAARAGGGEGRLAFLAEAEEEVFEPQEPAGGDGRGLGVAEWRG